MAQASAADPHDVRTRRLRAFWMTRVRRPFEDYRWLLLSVFAIAALVLGFIGLRAYDPSASVYDDLYHALQLFTSGTSVEPPIPLELEIARWLAWAVTLGATVGALLAILHDRVGRLRVLFARNHVLICGLGRIGLRLAVAFRAQGYRVVVVERDLSRPGVEACRRDGIIVLPGDATDADVLRRMRASLARYLIVVCGDDGVNVGVVMAAHGLAGTDPARPISCFVHVVDPEVRGLLRGSTLHAWKPGFRLQPFDVSELGTPTMLVRHPPFDEHGMTDVAEPHVAVVGLGQTGDRLITGLARSWAATPEAGSRRLRVTAIDLIGSKAMDAMRRHEPRLEDLLDVTVWDADVDSPAFPEGATAEDLRSATIVYVCLDEELRGLRTALILRDVMRDPRVPIVVRITERSTLTAFPEGLRSDQVNVAIYNMLDRACTPEVMLEGTIELLAKAIHADYVRAQTAEGATAASNPSLADWNDLPELLRGSNRDQAADIGRKLRLVGCDLRRVSDLGSATSFVFTPEQTEMLAREEHARWMQERQAQGFRHGPVVDLERKEHPDLVPWSDLSEATRDKDRNAIAGIPMFLARAGFEIVREDDRGSVGPGRPARASDTMPVSQP